ncbi:MAG: TIGR02221 family CRISPR-associated protein [Bacillota bacterium]
MAKVLISPLGVGPTDEEVSERQYRTARYKFDGSKKEYETPFVAAALSEHLKMDKIIMVGTSKSMWEKVYEYYSSHSGQTLDEDYWLEIAEKVGDSNHSNQELDNDDLTKINQAIDNYLQEINQEAVGGSCCKLINYGLNEEELWDNFDVFMTISEHLEDGDQIYLDITHSFRSIPLFMYLMFDFIDNLQQKDIELAGIYYGMLDVLKEMDYAPVVDLGPLFKISKWIRGVYDFTNYGNGYLISDLIADEKIGDKVRNISNLVNINYLTNLRTQINSLHKMISDYQNSQLRVLPYIMPQLKDFMGRFQGIEKDSMFQLEMAKWFFENKIYSNGYVCLVEAILTFGCELYDLDMTDYRNRKMMKGLLMDYNLAQKFDLGKKLADKFKTTNDIRRTLAHGGLTDASRSFKMDIDQSDKYYYDIKKLLEDDWFQSLADKITLQEIKEKTY